MKYTIKKIKPSGISRGYLETINHISTKRFIYFAKDGKYKKTKKDLVRYVKSLDKNQHLFGIYKNDRIHVANFKISIFNQEASLGFLVFLKYRGKGIIKNIFYKIMKLKLIKENKIKKLLLGVDKKNLNAIKLYKNLGFKFKKNSSSIMYLFL